MEEDSSPRQPDEVLTEEEESTSPRERMLTEEEVLKIFEHVHDSDRSLPPCLQYQVIPVDPNASKITPPPFNFKDGIFLLCVTDTPNFPQHLKERVSREPLKKSNFHWHPAKKDAAERLQMRNCYRYRNGNVGGPPAYLWTKLGNDGKEDLQYRLMHVRPSIKVTSAPAAERQPRDEVSIPQPQDVASTRARKSNESSLAQLGNDGKEDIRVQTRPTRILPSQTATVAPASAELQPGDVVSSPRPQDVASTRDRKWHKRPSNELFRSLCINAAQTVDTRDSQAVKKVSERIVDIIMIDRKGVFVRRKDESCGWVVMERRESVNKTSQAIRNWKIKEANGGWYKSKASVAKKKKKKKTIKKSSATRRTRLVYQAQAGAETSIHPYALLLISAVCNQPHEALRVLQSPLRGIFEEGRTETCAERAMRLQLRHRFAGALSTGITPQSFSQRLLQVWGGSLVQAEEGSSILNTDESQKAGGRQLAVTQSEKEADQDASEDANHESSDDADQSSGSEGEQTSTDAEEESDDSE